jgi:protein-L-isoaspartate(D-aspartate) O-methyltransferase
MGRSPKAGAPKARKIDIAPKSAAERRRVMVTEQIEARGIVAPPVLAAMCKVARESFVPDDLHAFAYEDRPLPIGEGQTISQPYIVAFMLEALKLKSHDRVLEVGTGSGYVAALLAEMAAEVFTVERIEPLARRATDELAKLGYTKVHVLNADGTRGWREHAPYDAILVSAGAPEVPRSLKDQLAIGGRLVIPVGDQMRTQELVRVVRLAPEDYAEEILTYVRFVPLWGEEGWRGEEE